MFGTPHFLALTSGAYYAVLFFFGIIAGIELARKNYTEEVLTNWTYWILPAMLWGAWLFGEISSQKTAQEKSEARIPEHIDRRPFSLVRGFILWSISMASLIYLTATNPFPFNPDVDSEAFSLLNNIHVVMFLTGFFALTEGPQVYFYYMHPLTAQKMQFATSAKKNVAAKLKYASRNR